MADKYQSLAAAIWQDPLPDHIKAGALIIVVERRGIYRRFFTANAAAAYGQIDRHSHISRFWRFDYGRCEPRRLQPGLVLRIVKAELQLVFAQSVYQAISEARAMLKAVESLGVNDAE